MSTPLLLLRLTLASWTAEWHLSVSDNKCGVLRIGKYDIVKQFSINNMPLPIVTSDLFSLYKFIYFIYLHT